MGVASNLSFIEHLAMTFYIADIKKTSFQRKEDIPNYLPDIIPVFFTLIMLEQVYNFWTNKRMLRINDSITSITLGMIMEIVKMFVGGILLIGYDWLYQYRLFEWDWNSGWTWCAAALGVDLGYYWLHRCSHEIGIAWSGHQVHHSSEEYNLTTALRQSAFQKFFSIGFYQPLALIGIPVPAVLVHLQINLYYQFWIHNEILMNLGPLEWVLNTPSHHSVHHGMNKWCLDKNYAGFLIIWDRMFGTFQPLKHHEPVVYGLVDQPQTFNPFYLQLFYFRDNARKAFLMDTWANALRSLFYGPGWQPGTPRLGDMNALPDKTPKRKMYDPKISQALNCYAVLNFFIAMSFQLMLTNNFSAYSLYKVFIIIGFLFSCFFTLGAIFDQKWWAPFFEAGRCAATALVFKIWPITALPTVDYVLVVYFWVCALYWGSQSLISLNGEKSLAWFWKNRSLNSYNNNGEEKLAKKGH